MHRRPRRLFHIVLLAAGCRASAPSGPVALPPQVNFELDCDSSDTSLASQLFCVRTDTRTGDIKIVTVQALPTSNGSTMTAERAPGSFSTVCDATSTERQSDFYCIRLDTVSGDMVLVNLQKLAAIPERKRPGP